MTEFAHHGECLRKDSLNNLELGAIRPCNRRLRRRMIRVRENSEMAHPRWRELEALADDDDLDGVLAIASLQELAASWCAYTRREENADDDPDWWAIAFFLSSDLYRRDDLCRGALEALVEFATTEFELGCIGAGPLENFASDDENDLQWLEAHARGSDKWRRAIAAMWVAGHVNDNTLRRLEVAARTQLARPRPRSEWPPEVLASTEAEERLVALAGPEWYLLDNATPDQERAISDFLRTTAAMLDRSNSEERADE